MWIRHADCQGAREGTNGEALTNLDEKEHWPLKRKNQGTGYGTQVTQPGCREQPFHLSLSFCPAAPFSPLYTSIPSMLKNHDSPSVMESLWEGLIAFFALFRCTNRPLLTIITQSSYIIQTGSIFHALNMSQALYLSLIVQQAMQACFRI